MNSNWKSAKLSDVCAKISDGTHHSPEVQHREPGKGRFKYVTSKNIRPWGLDLGDIAYVDEKVHREIYARCQPELGDVLLTKDGANTGNVAINTLDEEFSLLSSVALLKPKRNVLEPRFLRYYIESPVGSKRLLGEMTGTAIRRIILKKIKDTEIRFPPLPEQRRIVAEIEKQFTRLDAGIAALRRVQANLKRYRAAVLKAACEGRLVPTEAELVAAASRRSSNTKQSRPGSATFESGETLLARILTERRQNWQGRGKYKEPVAPDTTKLSPLPEGYTWASFGQICRVQGGFAFKSTEYVKEGVPLVRISNLVDGHVQVSQDTVFLPPDFISTYSAFVLRKGDALIAMSGATTGKMATMEEDIPALLNQRVGRFVLSSPELSIAKFVSYLVMQVTQKVLISAYGAAQPNISPSEIEEMPVPLPPLAEQTRIVAEVERRLSVIKELDSFVTANLQRTNRLRQSILQKAFTGELAC